MRGLFPGKRPALVLAPMQDVTDLPFMRVIARRGAPDWFVTEYFRVHPESRLDRRILRSITENRTGGPVFAQLIGSDADGLARTARELAAHPIAGIDLNLGCPAPVVCRKNAGGGLLRDPEEVRRLVGTLREAVDGCLTVKTRVGYDDDDGFARLLEIFRESEIDGLSIHGRTVLDRYQTPVRPDCVRLAVETMPCPVIANGNVVDVETGLAYQARTGSAGLMVGRGAIRNPWIFSQLAAAWEGRDSERPTHRDLMAYVFELCDEVAAEEPSFDPHKHVQRMKKHLAYISHGLGGDFEHRVRRVRAPGEFEEIVRSCLDHDEPMPARPPADSKLFCGFSDLLGAGSPRDASVSANPSAFHARDCAEVADRLGSGSS